MLRIDGRIASAHPGALEERHLLCHQSTAFATSYRLHLK
jgi:hypothetical protein